MMECHVDFEQHAVMTVWLGSSARAWSTCSQVHLMHAKTADRSFYSHQVLN